MKKPLIVYYSKSGSNQYLAERFARQLNCEIEAIQPSVNIWGWLLFASWFNLGSGIRRFKHQLKDFDSLVVCGPIWMGCLVSPVHSAIARGKKQVKNLYFATCCGGSDAIKNDKFGYMNVFAKIRKVAEPNLVECEAFPIPLVVHEDKLEDGNTIMKTRLTDENFKGEILRRFEVFVDKIRSR